MPTAHRLATLVGVLILVLWTTSSALAQPVLITSPTTVGPLDTEIMSADGTVVPLATAEITVDGTTLTINGRHTIASLMVGPSATVTHDAGFVFDYSGGAGTDMIYGLDLATTGNAMIDFGGAINADGRGHGADEGPGAGALDPVWAGGGAHGGEGGPSGTGAPGGLPYGSVVEPSLFGSGGGTDLGAQLGRPGGGAIRLTITGTLTHNGVIEADGINGASFSEDGGGAGGSIWIDAGSILGTSGVTRANGGIGDPGGSGAGAGSGGRVAIYSDGLIPPDLINLATAYGGDGFSSGITGGDGGAGTVYISQAGNATLIIDNRDLDGRITPLTGLDAFAAPFDGDLLVRNLGKAGPAPMEALDLHILGNVIIERDGIITADGRGFSADQGPGAGRLDPSWAGGGAHGGEGGISGTSAPGGLPYGSVLEPTTFGSGGGTDIGTGIGQPGGGAIKLVIDGTLTLNGVIEADGFGSASFSEDGGAAGGSIWIDTGAFAGATGSIRANGGVGDPGGSGAGAGSGGRIAVYSGTALPRFFSDRINAYGGDGFSSGITGGDGSAGTVYLNEAGQATLIIDNNTLDGRITPMSNTDIFASPFDGDVVVRRRGKLGPAQLELLDMEVLGDVTVASDGLITATGRGFPADEGPGAGRLDASWAGGGAHGGQGGNSGTGALGGESYGSVLQPTTFGSGGGSDLGAAVGRPGGGAVKLFVGGTLNIEGVIEADGFNGASFSEDGGGAGGSLWINARAITGTTGVVKANGGIGDPGGSGAGAGSGGRLAIYVDAPLPPLFADRITAFGGDGWASGILGGDGGAGTVYIEEMGAGRFIIANNGLDGRITTIGSANPEVDPDGRFALDVPVDIRGGGKLGPQRGEFVHFDFGGDVSVAGNSAITATGMGFATDEGPGAGMAGRIYGGGAGHAGRGADAAAGDPDALGGEPYGIDTFPITLGSGGGTDPDADREGGAGGGAFRLSVAGTLDLAGGVFADGIGGRGGQAGGGAGGSVWIEAGSITGVNGIFARGGAGGEGVGGGGSGGYIAVYSCDVSSSVTASVVGGGAGARKGEDGRTLFGSTSVEFLTQPPADVMLRAGERLELSVTTAGPASYQWRRDGVELVDDGRISGATSDTLVITGVTIDDAGRYDVLATDSCGARPSTPTIVMIDDSCRADIDGDGELTIFDFLAFQNAFDRGDPAADFDGDGDFTIFDFLAFQNEFDAGCP